MDSSKYTGHEPVFVYATASSVEEAKNIGAMVVNERLAACVNVIGGVMSIYRWEGGMTENMEAMLLVKTTRGRLAALTRRIEALHSYEVPCIAVLPVESVSAGFGAWIAAETR